MISKKMAIIAGIMVAYLFVGGLVSDYTDDAPLVVLGITLGGFALIYYLYKYFKN